MIVKKMTDWNVDGRRILAYIWGPPWIRNDLSPAVHVYPWSPRHLSYFRNKSPFPFLNFSILLFLLLLFCFAPRKKKNVVHVADATNNLVRVCRAFSKRCFLLRLFINYIRVCYRVSQSLFTYVAADNGSDVLCVTVLFPLLLPSPTPCTGYMSMLLSFAVSCSSSFNRLR